MPFCLSHSASQEDEPIAVCSMVPSQYLLLDSVQSQVALGHQTLNLKPSRESLVWIIHKAAEISTSWKKKEEMKFVKLAQVICSVLIRWCWQLSRRTVTAFFTAWGFKDSALSCNSPSIKVADLASVFNLIFGHLLLSSLATGFLVVLVICDPSFDSSGGVHEVNVGESLAVLTP